ncbi:hypothetical protein MTR67_014068 [Solanum verrucosum]|uniref:Uncharacterized protein n=1 Tax=Solanum verrucosum TaxID=315347 RepID=A0AAF0QCN5_SOLVR|nr:hypothetical protein MTR67_014068 [Solanum verrucosum]
MFFMQKNWSQENYMLRAKCCIKIHLFFLFFVNIFDLIFFGTNCCFCCYYL